MANRERQAQEQRALFAAAERARLIEEAAVRRRVGARQRERRVNK